jgi:hypothetical protein
LSTLPCKNGFVIHLIIWNAIAGLYTFIISSQFISFFITMGHLSFPSRTAIPNSPNKHREEKPTRCHWMVYCTYNMPKMFRALLCPSSGARDYRIVITAYDVQCLVAGCRGSDAEQQAMCPEREMLHDCNIPLPEHIACCPAPDSRQPATKYCTP